METTLVTIPSIKKRHINHWISVALLLLSVIDLSRAEECFKSPKFPSTSLLSQEMVVEVGGDMGLLDVDNNTELRLALLLKDASGRWKQAVFVEPTSSLRVAVRPQSYALDIYLGNDWCNHHIGFKDADALRFFYQEGLSVEDDRLTKIDILPSREYGAAANISISDAPRSRVDEEFTAENGVYKSTGTVNGLPVTMLVDTGASYVAMTRAVAEKAGITTCSRQGFANTANGVIRSCLSRAETVTIGKLVLEDVPVSIGGDHSYVLFGMSAISRLDMQVSENKMTLSGPAGDALRKPVKAMAQTSNFYADVYSNDAAREGLRLANMRYDEVVSGESVLRNTPRKILSRAHLLAHDIDPASLIGWAALAIIGCLSISGLVLSRFRPAMTSDDGVVLRFMPKHRRKK